MTQDNNDLQTQMILKLLEPLIISDSFRCAFISLKNWWTHIWRVVLPLPLTQTLDQKRHGTKNNEWKIYRVWHSFLHQLGEQTSTMRMERNQCPKACLWGRVSGQCDPEPPTTTQCSTNALGTQSQFTPWKKHKGIALKPILCQEQLHYGSDHLAQREKSV